VNTPGSFRCYCDGRLGKTLSPDFRSCEVTHTHTHTHTHMYFDHMISAARSLKALIDSVCSCLSDLDDEGGASEPHPPMTSSAHCPMGEQP